MAEVQEAEPPGRVPGAKPLALLASPDCPGIKVLPAFPGDGGRETCRTSNFKISLHYEDAGSGDPPVLLLHELGGSSESWRRVVPLIAPHRRVIALDLRCAGRSEKPPAPFDMIDLADEVAEFIKRAHRGVDVIGAALGAMLAELWPSGIRSRALHGVVQP